MAGRKPAVPPSEVINAVIQFKESIIHVNHNGKKGKYTTIITFFSKSE